MSVCTNERASTDGLRFVATAELCQIVVLICPPCTELLSTRGYTVSNSVFQWEELGSWEGWSLKGCVV